MIEFLVSAALVVAAGYFIYTRLNRQPDAGSARPSDNVDNYER